MELLVPIIVVTVTTEPMEGGIIDVARHITAEDDNQDVVKHTAAKLDVVGVVSVIPNPNPRTVKLAPPVVGRLYMVL